MTRHPTASLPTFCAPFQDDINRIVKEGGLLCLRVDGELITHRVQKPRVKARPARVAPVAGSLAA